MSIAIRMPAMIPLLLMIIGIRETVLKMTVMMRLMTTMMRLLHVHGRLRGSDLLMLAQLQEELHRLLHKVVRVGIVNLWQRRNQSGNLQRMAPKPCSNHFRKYVTGITSMIPMESVKADRKKHVMLPSAESTQQLVREKQDENEVLGDWHCNLLSDKNRLGERGGF